MMTLTRRNGYLSSYYKISAMGQPVGSVCIPQNAGAGSNIFRELEA